MAARPARTTQQERVLKHKRKPQMKQNTLKQCILVTTRQENKVRVTRCCLMSISGGMQLPVVASSKHISLLALCSVSNHREKALKPSQLCRSLHRDRDQSPGCSLLLQLQGCKPFHSQVSRLLGAEDVAGCEPMSSWPRKMRLASRPRASQER